ITNQPAGAILANGTMSLTASNGNILNDMSYGSGSTDNVGTIQSNGALTISAVGTGVGKGVLTNHGYIDSTSSNITITANRVDNVSIAPSGTTSGTTVVLLPNTLGNVGVDNMFAGTVFPKISLHDQV